MCGRDISARGLGSEQSPDPCRSVQRAGLTSGPASWAHQRGRPKVATCPSSLGHTVTAKGGSEGARTGALGILYAYRRCLRRWLDLRRLHCDL